MEYELSEEEARGTYVIIPSFNEERVIRNTVERVRSLGVHVVVVDDCSQDGTISELQDLSINVLRHITNLGQGAALQTGIDFALERSARFLVTFDADGQHDERDIPKLVHKLVEDDLDVALGSRFLGRAPGMPWARKALLKAAILFTRLTLDMNLTDVHNGLRVFRAEVASTLRISQNRMAHASEILHKIRKARLRYAEVPASVSYSQYSKDKGQSALEAVDIVYELLVKRLVR